MRVCAATHPDTERGSHDLFIWCGTIKDTVCGGELRVESKPEPSDNPSRRREPSTDDKPRIPHPDATDFEEVTRTALHMADADTLYGDVLSYLADCYPLEHLVHEQERGASYRRLAAIAHTWGLSKEERSGWDRVAAPVDTEPPLQLKSPPPQPVRQVGRRRFKAGGG